MADKLVCQEDGCTGEADRYYYPDDDAFDVLCVEHAVQAGFCFMCGNFWAGVEAFDFSRIAGVCPNCIHEFDEPEDDDDFGSVHYY
jgi:hypothetical protein